MARSQATTVDAYIAEAPNAEALAGLAHGKGCLRFRRPERMDFAFVERLLRDARARDRGPCERRRRAADSRAGPL